MTENYQSYKKFGELYRVMSDEVGRSEILKSRDHLGRQRGKSVISSLPITPNCSVLNTSRITETRTKACDEERSYVCFSCSLRLHVVQEPSLTSEVNGAKGDGKTDNANALSVRNRIHIPRGTFYMSDVTFKGPCKGKIVFFNSGTLLAPANAKHIKQDVWINFRYVDNLAISGSGTIDGQGSHSCPNTDGIKIGSSSNVKIWNSHIGTGDDCIAIVSGNTNIDIHNITLWSRTWDKGRKLGKVQTKKNVEGVRVRDTVFIRTSDGIRFKTWES
ncbi:hypothetical protein YC2023_111894 [Brassica napus]